MSQPPPLPPRELPPPLPAEDDPVPHGYRQIAKVTWWRCLLFFVGIPLELRQSIVVRKPWLTWGLALIITITTCMLWAEPEQWVALVFNPNATGTAYLTGLFGYPLLHLDGWHLVGNLYFLLVFGNNVECRFGRRRMLGLFVAASVCGALLHGAFTDARLIGASGGIFGILVLYALMFPQARILWLPLGLIIRGIVLLVGREWLPKGMSVITWIVIYMLFQGFVVYEQFFMDGRVSALSHIGGGLAGVAFFVLWKRGWLP